MRTYLPKMLLFFVALASIFSFLACTSGGTNLSGLDFLQPSSSSSDVSPSQSDDSSSSSSAVVSSSGTIDLSSSAIESSSSAVNLSSSATASSSSSARLSSSSRSSSSSVRSSSSATTPSSSSARSSSSATTPSSSSVTAVPLPLPVGPISCTRAGLEAAVNSYLAAIAAGDYTKMSLTGDAKYFENDHDAKQNYSTGKYDKAVNFGEGLWKTPLKVDFHRNLIDVDSCATFTEIIVANSEPQYVLGARLDVKDNKISKVTLVVTQKGDWGFNAKNYLNYSTKEDWSILPVTADRRSRTQLQSDGYAYFKYFTDKTAPAPWATPCARLEGGAYTGDSKNSSCNVGIPDGTSITPISYLADVDYGMVVVFMYFGGADSHWFRILPAGYRYIHTLTAMKQSDYQAPK